MLNRVLLYIVCFFSFSSWAFQLDWSGYFKSQVYYIRPVVEKNTSSPDPDVQSSVVEPYTLYNDHDLVLDVKARASDGLLVTSKMSIFSEKSLNEPKVSSYPKRAIMGGESESSLLEVTHFYATRTGEYYKFDFGRLPFDFGLGMTYSDGEHFTHVAYDVRDAVSLEVRSDSLFIKPYAIFKKENKMEWALQGGYEKKEFGGQALYSLSTNSPDTFNVYGYYHHDPFSLGVEWGALRSDTGFQSMASVVELDWKTSFYSSQFKLLGGYITEDDKSTSANESYVLNANYNPTFIFWDYFHSSEEERTDGLSECIFLTLIGSVPLGEYFKISLFDTIIKSSSLKDLGIKGNEIVLVGSYDSKKGFYWENKLAFLWMLNDKNHIGAVTRAVVRF